jgi:hypothetical protein
MGGGEGGFPMNFLLIDDYAPVPLPRAYLRPGRVSLSVTKDCQEDVYTYVFVCKHKV